MFMSPKIMSVQTGTALYPVQGTACKSGVVKMNVDHHPCLSRIQTASVPTLMSESGSHYEVGQLVRRTRQGRVHRANRLVKHHRSADCFVRCTTEHLAIKIFDKGNMKKLTGSEDIPSNEMLAMEVLSRSQPHPNLLPITECFSDAAFAYMVMPYIADGDLLDVMERERRSLSPREARHMFRDLMAALDHLHSHDIAHRDLSLENILHDAENDNFILIDLGLCLCLPKGTGSIPCRAICGKKNYIAPEIWRRCPLYNPKHADIWAAGIVLFMALTSAAPMAQAIPSDRHFAAIVDNRLDDVLRATFDEDAMPKQDIELSLAMDLVQKILREDPQQRLSIAEILAHPFMIMTTEVPETA